MQTRNYGSTEEEFIESAAIIASEVILNGFSEGWISDSLPAVNALEEVSKILRGYNIEYTDDMRGMWARR